MGSQAYNQTENITSLVHSSTTAPYKLIYQANKENKIFK